MPEPIPQTLKIAIVGPESTGKSMLSEGLAKHYHSPWVPEYAREYIEQKFDGRNYNPAEIQREDITAIAKGQLAAEDRSLASSPKLLFCDTNLLVCKVWTENAFNEPDLFIDSNIANRHYALTLLCDIDLPWAYDELREHPHLRTFFYDWYHRLLTDFGFRFVKISGTGNARLQAAIDAVDSFLTGNAACI
ncbi:MAG: ATP-binding protein [Bacteroidota bacterium]